MVGRGQLSLEFILVIAFTFAIIIPGIFFFYSYSQSSSASFSANQYDRLGQEIVSTAVQTIAQGKGSWLTLDILVPKNVQNISVTQDGSELVIAFHTPEGVSEAVFFSDTVNLSGLGDAEDGTIYNGRPHGGPLRIRFYAGEDGVVDIIEDNGTWMPPPEPECGGYAGDCPGSKVDGETCQYSSPTCTDGTCEYDYSDPWVACDSSLQDNKCYFYGDEYPVCDSDNGWYCPATMLLNESCLSPNYYPPRDECWYNTTADGNYCTTTGCTTINASPKPDCPQVYCDPTQAPGWICPIVEDCDNRKDDDGNGLIDEQDSFCELNLTFISNPTGPGRYVIANLTAPDGAIYHGGNTTILCTEGCADGGGCVGEQLCTMRIGGLTVSENEAPFFFCSITAPKALEKHRYVACLNENNATENLTVQHPCLLTDLASDFALCRLINVTHQAREPYMLWHFDEGAGDRAYDAGSMGNYGEITGATWVDGVINSSLSFNGVNDYVWMEGDNLNVTNESFSFSLWFKLNETINPTTTSTMSLIAKTDDAAGDWQLLFVSGDDGRLRFKTYSDNIQTTQDTWQADTWYHLVLVYHNNSFTQIFVDGLEDNFDTYGYGVGTLEQTNEPIYVGVEYKADGKPPYRTPFEGAIDELHIDKGVLNESDVKKRYCAEGWHLEQKGELTLPSWCDDFLYLDYQVPVDTSVLWPSGMIGDWHFDIATGNRTVDSSGYAYDGWFGDGVSRVSGIEGKALSFDGVQGYVNLSNWTHFAATHYTISAWVNVPVTHELMKVLLTRRSRTTWYEVNYLLKIDKYGRPSLTHVTALNKGNTTKAFVSLSGTGWRHLVALYDGTSQKIYIDGSLKAESSGSIGDPRTGGDQLLWFGQDSFYDPVNNPQTFFAGSIDEVQLYDRALTPEEINQTYCTGAWLLNQSGAYVYPDSCIKTFSGSYSYSGADYRFTDQDGSLLDHWQEDTNRAWVRIPKLRREGTSEVLLYYGNGTAASVSDGDDTFRFFDDFEDGSISATKWVSIIAGKFPPVTEHDGLIDIHKSGDTAASLTTKYAYSVPFALERKVLVKPEGYTEAKTYYYPRASEKLSSDLWILNYLFRWGSLGIPGMGGYAPNGTWFQMEHLLNGSHVSWVNHEYNGSLLYERSGKTTFSTGTITTSAGNAQADSRGRVFLDHFFIREYTEPEPSVVIGGPTLTVQKSKEKT